MTVKGNWNRKEYGGKSGDGLDTAVKRAKWPTPCARDHHASGPCNLDRSNGHMVSLSTLVEKSRKTEIQGGCNGYLNPDWVEWLMNWPFGWTNPDADALIWLAPEDDPADLDPNADGYIPRITTTKTNRVKRIETLGNGQFPLTAAAAFIFGRAILAACNKQRKLTPCASPHA